MPRNYRKNPHTARFLQTFHSGIGSNGVNYRQEMGVESEERSATEFVSGVAPVKFAAPAPVSTEEIFISGWRILTGPGLVSKAQAKWIVDIAEKSEGVTDAMVKSLSERLAQGFARSAASEFITKYKDLPRRITATQIKAGHAVEGGDPTTKSAPEVGPGRYALEHPDGIKFYRVTTGKGRWAGRTFLEVQASDDFHPIRDAHHRANLLAVIAANPHEAMVRYGHELGVCGRCGRTLTDESSRAAGIGPVCAAK